MYIDAADPMSGYARYADDSLCDGTETAQWEVRGTGAETKLALVATETIQRGTPIRALYGWSYWYQPALHSIEIMKKAFAGYLPLITADDDEDTAWSFASSVGCTAALLEAWNGVERHRVNDKNVDSSSECDCDDSTNDDAANSLFTTVTGDTQTSSVIGNTDAMSA